MLAIPPFEFFGLTSGLDVDKLYVRDHGQAWYQAGLPGVASNLGAIADYLRDTIAEADARRVVMVGNSMGGYAAMVFGALVGADVVHSFAPQSFVDHLHRLWHRDTRWRKQMRAMYRLPENRHLDARRLLAGRRAGCPIHVYYDAGDRLDAIHAERLDGLPGIELHAYSSGGHGVVRHMKASGELQGLLQGAISGDAPSPANSSAGAVSRRARDLRGGRGRQRGVFASRVPFPHYLCRP